MFDREPAGWVTELTATGDPVLPPGLNVSRETIGEEGRMSEGNRPAWGPDNPPKTREEYVARFEASQRVSGVGFDVTSHIPCPFCAAPDFLVAKLLNVETGEMFGQVLERGAVCRECGRGARGLTVRTANGVTIEMVQTCGPDAVAPWLPPMRRDPMPPRGKTAEEVAGVHGVIVRPSTLERIREHAAGCTLPSGHEGECHVPGRG